MARRVGKLGEAEAQLARLLQLTVRLRLHIYLAHVAEMADGVQQCSLLRKQQQQRDS